MCEDVCCEAGCVGGGQIEPNFVTIFWQSSEMAEK